MPDEHKITQTKSEIRPPRQVTKIRTVSDQHSISTQNTRPLVSHSSFNDVRRWPPEPHNYRSSNSLRGAILWLLAILACLFILSGLFLIISNSSQSYKNTLQQLAIQRSQATQAVIATSNAHAQGTANVLGTIQASIQETATGVSQESIQATATIDEATAITSNLTTQYTQDISGAPTFENALLLDRNPGTWDTVKQNTRNGCTFHNDSYHAYEAAQGYLQACIAEDTNFKNFTYQAIVILNSGLQGQAGLLFHINANNTAYYFFNIDDQGNYALDLYNSQGTAQSLIKGQSTSLHINMGQSNTLGVSAQGQTYSLFANGAYLTSVNDSSLSDGKIGLAVLNTNTPTDATFRSAQVWKQ